MSRRFAAILRSLFRKPLASGKIATKAGRPFRIRLEPLEDRWMPASVQFTTASETIDQSAGAFSIPLTLTGTATPQTVVSTLAAGFAEPHEIAVDSSGIIYVSNFDNGTISRISPNGTVSGFAAIGNPEGIAVNAAGDVYVAATGTNSIDEITPSGAVSTFLTGLNQQGPVWLACDASGNVYFTNSAMSGEEVEVSKATPSGSVSTFVNAGNYANGLAVHNGDLYLSVFDNDGGDDDTVDQVTAAGIITPYATGFTDPAGLAFDSAGNLYVANSYPGVNTVSIVAPGGSISTYESGFGEPTGLADSGSSLFVSNQISGTVSEVASGVAVPFSIGGTATEGIDYANLTPSPLFIPAGQSSAAISGTLLYDPGENQTLSFTLGSPTGATLGSPSANVLTIGDPAGPTVQFESASESVPATAGSFTIPVTLSNSPLPTVTTFATGLDEPWGMAADSAGNLYVSNYGNSTISKISPNGTVTPFAAVADPEGLAINSAGDLFVASSDSIDEVTPSGVVSTFVSELNPQGGVWVACDAEGNVYFTNSAHSGEEVEVSKVNSSGQVSTFVNDGSYANGLAFDSEGNLYVSNFENMGALDDSVDVVSPAGVITPYASIATGFSDPAGLAFDPAGNLYVASTYPTVDTVSEVTPTGTISVYASGLSQPKGVVFANGNLYVDNSTAGTVDELNASVTVPFSPSGTAVAGTDYNNLTASPLSFPTGQTSSSISGTLIPDPGPNKTLTFTLGAPTGAIVGSPSANTLTIEEPDKLTPTSGNNNQEPAGESFGDLVATVTDSNGDPIPGVTVTFAGPGSGAGVTFPDGKTAVTNASGQAMVVADANTVAGSYTVTASASGVAAPADFSLTNLPGPANHLAFEVEPDDGTAGNALSPSVQVGIYDEYGNLLANDNSDTVTLSVASGPGQFAAGSASTESVGGGIAIFDNLVLDTAGTYTLRETASTGAGGISGPNSTRFAISANAPDQLAFGVQPGAATAGSVINPAVQVDVLDQFGNPVTTDDTDEVTLAIAFGPGNLAAGSSTSAQVSDGVAIFNNLILDTAGSYTLSESATSGLTGNASDSFTVNPAKPDHLEFSVQPTDATAGNAIAPAVQVELYDEYGNLLTNDSSDQVTLSVASGPGGLAANGSATATASGGVATFPNVVLDTEGDYTLKATGSGGITGPASSSFQVGYGSPGQLAFLVQPSAATAGSAIAPAVQVEVLDDYGNVVADDNSDSIIMSVASGPGGFDPSSTLNETTTDGVATFDNLVLDNAGTYTLGETSVSGLTGNPSASFSVNAGTPDHLAFSVQPGTASAGSAINPAVQVDVLDKYGNLVTTDSNDQVTLGIATGPGSFAAGSSTSATSSDGIATFNDLVLDTAGSFTLSESTTSGLTGNASDAFTVNPGKPDHLAFTQEPTDVTAGEAITPAIQVDLYDEYGNLLTNDDSDQVTLSVASGSGGLAANGSATAIVSGGVATFSNAILDTEGDYTLAATGPGGITGPASTSFHVGYRSPFQLGFYVQPAAATAGSALDPAVQVEVLDRFGNLVADDDGDAIAVSMASGPGGLDPSSQTNAVTTNGIATFSNLVLDKAGTYSLSATDADGLASATSNLFTVGASTPDQLMFAVEPGTATAGNPISPAVQLKVLDQYGNWVESDNSGQVSLDVASGPGGFDANSIESASVVNGVVTFGNLILDTAGSYTLETEGESFPTITSTPFTVQAGAASAATSLVTVAEEADAAGTTDTVTLQAVDAYGNDVATGGLSVAFDLYSLTGGQGTFTTATDNHNGTYTATFTGSIAGDNEITATIAKQPIGTAAVPITVTPGVVDPQESTLAISSSDIEPGGEIAILIQAFDAFGNADPTGVTTPTLSLIDGSPIGQFNGLTDTGDGVYTATLTGQTDGTNTLIASINGTQIGTNTPPTVTVSGSPFSLSRTTVIVSPGTILSGGETTVELVAKNAQGRQEPAGGLVVAFSLNNAKGAQGDFGPVSDFGDGIYMATFTGILAGTNTIIATIDSEKVTARPAVKVNPGPVSLATSVVTLSSDTVKAGSKITVTLQPEDADGNKITKSGLGVTFQLGSGTGEGAFGPVTYHPNGTYTAVFTGKLVGTSPVLAFVKGQQVTTPPSHSITITPGPVSQKTSVLTASQETVAVGGAISIMLQAKDAYGNDLTTGGSKVTFALASKTGGKGSFVDLIDNGDGTYTAEFEASATGKNTIVATINGVKVTSSVAIMVS